MASSDGQRTRVGQLPQSVTGPDIAAGERIEGVETQRETDQEQILSAERRDDRRAPRTAELIDLLRYHVGKVPPPHLGARALVQGHHKGAQAGSGVENHQVAVDHRTGAITPHVLELAQVATPQLGSVNVVGVEAGGPMPHDHALAVGHG